MIIELKKFGITLTSRDDGREALSAFQPTLNKLAKDEVIEISFDGVNTLTPSWADEFIMALNIAYPGKLKLQASDNPSIKATLSLLEGIHKIKLLK